MITALLFLTAFTLGNPDDDAKAALALALSKPVPKADPVKPAEPIETKEPPAAMTYGEACEKSKKDNMPLVVFVGYEDRELSGVVACSVTSQRWFDLTGERFSGIVVSRHRQGVHEWVRNLPADASDVEILTTAIQYLPTVRAIPGGRIERLLAIPFRHRERVAADDE